MSNITQLSKCGDRLVANEYRIVPIPPGSKGPKLPKWQQLHADSDQVAKWAANGVANHGVGVITANTPAIDLDINDQAAADEFEMWIGDNYAWAPVRIGQAPKRLLVFRCDEPFRKMKSNVYVDDSGQQHHVEVLADGQQFVAFAVHPDTGLPYTWPAQSILDVPRDKLPELTEIDAAAIINEFEAFAADKGWQINEKKASKRTVKSADNAFENFSGPLPDWDLSKIEAELLQHLSAEEYDDWTTCGMALYHQTGGSMAGLAAWVRWSQTADTYNENEDLEAKWSGFKPDYSKKPVTLATLIHRVNEVKALEKHNVVDNLESLIVDADNIYTLTEKVAQQIAKSPLGDLERERLAQAMKTKFKDLDGKSIGIGHFRSLIKPKVPKKRQMPDWVAGWHYIEELDKFAKVNGSLLSMQGFNAKYGREALIYLGEQGHAPSMSASAIALNTCRLPTVRGIRYAPGKDEVYTEDGDEYLNSWDESVLPDLPLVYSDEDEAAIACVENHIAVLFPSKATQNIVLDYLAWVVQNPGKKTRWAMFFQGAGGEGKSILQGFMGAVLGVKNVQSVNGDTLNSSFTNWADATQMTFIEEIKWQGHNRFDIVNRIKPYISDSRIEIHPKGRPTYNTQNNTSYVMFSNYRDALPIDKDDRRYFVAFTQFSSREQVKKFVAENPDHFDKLVAAWENHPGALRKWLLNRKFSEGFNALGSAPDSANKASLSAMSVSPLEEAFEELLEDENIPHINEQWVSATALIAHLTSPMSESGFSKKDGASIRRFLGNRGYEYVSRTRAGGTQHRIWTRTELAQTTDSGDVASTLDLENIRIIINRAVDNSEEENFK